MNKIEKKEKILIMPDIHGRTFWKDAFELHPGLDTIFLGDYVDPYDGREQEALDNFKEIIEYARKNNWNLLLGNHDLHYFLDIRGCRKDKEREKEIRQLFLDNLDLFNLAAVRKIEGKYYMFTHAPVFKGWVDEFELPLHPVYLADKLNNMLHDLENNKETLECILDRVSRYRGGRDNWASMIWADVDELRFKEAEILPDIDYSIFGHTQEPVKGIQPTYACIDNHHAYVLMNDGELVPEFAGKPKPWWEAISDFD